MIYEEIEQSIKDIIIYFLTATATVWKISRFISSAKSDFHTIDNLSIAFPTYVDIDFSRGDIAA